MLPLLLFSGVAATYLHKKFPKTTEAVAHGIVKSTTWSAKKVVKMIDNYYADPVPAEPVVEDPFAGMRACCIEIFTREPERLVCTCCGSTRIQNW